MNITTGTVKAATLTPATWRSTYVLKPDVKLLATSLIDYGWISPIIVTKSGLIIDGYQRASLALTNKTILRRDDGMVPVTVVDVDEIDARLMHVRLNRARGLVVPKYLSRLVKDVLRSKKYDHETLKKMLGMGVDEFDLLLEGDLLKSRDIANHTFSKAWTPIESNGKEIPVIERPPNADK